MIRSRPGRCAPLLALWLGACATPLSRTDQDSDSRFPATGRVGVISSISPPAVDTSNLPWAPDNVAEGSVGGAVAGGAYLAYFFCMPPSPLILACLVAAGAGTTLGAADGANAASKADSVRAAGSALHTGGANVSLQGMLRKRVLQVAADSPQPSLVDLGDGDATTAVGLEATRTMTGVDHVLELTLLRIGIGPTGRDRLGITMHAVSRIVNAADGSVASPRNHYYVGPSVALADWKADGPRRLQEGLDAGLDALARDILN